MPRLAKGELAPGVQAKQQRAFQSTQCIIRILNDASESGSFLGDDSLLFCRMSDLAAMNDGERRISPMSVRTLRNNIEALYPGGVKAFKNRVAELGGKKRVTNSTGSAEEWLEDAVLDMTARYSDLLQRFKKLSAGSDAVADELRRHCERYRGHVTLQVVK